MKRKREMKASKGKLRRGRKGTKKDEERVRRKMVKGYEKRKKGREISNKR